MPKAAMMTATSTATEAAAAATATATELVREGYGRLVRGANSICVKNTFSCCACFKYNTQPAKKQQQQQRRQRVVNCIIFKGTN